MRILSSLKLQKKFTAFLTLFSLSLNIFQPAFLALSLAPVVTPAAARAEDVVTEPTPTPSADPTAEPSAEPTLSPSPSAEPSVAPSPEVSPAPSASVLPSATPSENPTPAPSTDTPTNPEPSADSSPAPPATESPTPSAAPVNLDEELHIVVIENTEAESIGEFDLEVTETGSAQLSTDKLDYAPTDTALITGNDFLPNTTYSLTISSTDEPATSTTVDVTTDELGTLFYAYQLDGIYRPNYRVEAKDSTGAIVAVITFTDSESSATTLPFSDSFGSSTVNNVTSWDDNDGGSSDTRIEGTGGRPGSPTTGHVQIEDGGWVRRTINATGFQSLQLKYYWLGDAQAESDDNGIIEYCTGATCNSSFNNLGSHQLNNTSWSGEQTINLPASLNNSTFRIRFRTDASANDEHFRIDDISITGSDLALPDLVVLKTNNVGGSTTVNNPFTWTLTVSNIGAGTATFTDNQDILQDNLPDSNDFDYSPTSNISVSTAGGVTGGFDCDIDNGDDLDCDADGTVTIPAGGSFSLNITSTPTSTGTFTNPRSGDGNKCQVDPDNLVTEDIGGNNNCGDTVEVVEVPPVINPTLNATCGLDIALVLDNSTSIDSGEMTSMKAAITAFITALSGTPTQYSVSRFATTASVVQAFTGNTTDVNNAINAIPVGGGYTNWEDGLLKGQSTFDPRPNPNLLIFASDGNPNTIGDGSDPGGASESEAVDAAQVIANALKTGDTRILAIGIGEDLNTANLQAISGPNTNTGNILTSDVITTDFDTLAGQLNTFASQTCGGTITVTKKIDADGNLGTPGDQTVASGWSFNVGGQADKVTDANGQTPAVTLVAGSNYSVTETLQAGYNLLQASCTGATNNGSANLANNNVSGIQIENTDIVSCTFVNTPVPETVDICHATGAHGNPYITNSPSKSGDVSGHDDHNGPTWFPGIAVEWGDIIPPFDYPGGSYPGQNWDTAGQAIYNNGCNVPNGTLTVTKNLLPNNDSGLFNLTIGGTTYASNVGHNGTTGAQSVAPDTYTVGETAGTATSLTNYTTTYGGDCNAQGQVTVGVAENKTCTITNTRKTGSITFLKEVIGGDAEPTDWEFDVLNVGTFQNGTFVFNTGTYSVTESSDVLGYSLTSVGGVCSDANLASGSATLTVSEQGGTCTFTNTRDTGSVKVNKLLDNDGNGSFETANPAAFNWSLDGVGENAMGSTVSNVTTTVSGVTHSVNENTVANYHFVGWYPTASTQYSCANPQGTTLPLTVSVSKNTTTEITFCNQRDTGSIRITKDVTPGTNNQDFSFSGTLGAFILDDDGNNSNTRSNTALFSGIAAGSYAITEGSVPTWVLDSLTCTGDPDYQVNGSTVTVDLDHGENVVCTFVNRQPTGTITIIKDAIPTSEDNFSFDVSSGFTGGDFELEDDGSDNNGGTEESKTVTVVAGQYTVEEDGENGWQLSNLVCNDNNSLVNLGSRTATINVEDGENVTCTFTNQKLATLIIKKDATPNSDDNFRFTRSFGGFFELEDDGSDNNGGTDETATFSNLVPGTYSVTEDSEDGWVLSDIVCSDQTAGNLENRSVSVDLSYNETVTCTFRNTELGKIEGYKFNDQDGDGNKDSNEPRLNGWQIFIDENGNSLYDSGEPEDTTSGSFWFFGWYDLGAYSFDNLLPGEYRVCEVQQDGWYNSAPVCQTTTLTAGDTDDLNFANHEALTIQASKIVCELESDLPNWGDNDAPNITASTAQDYVESHPGCRLEEGWDFQYGYDGAVTKYGNGDQLGTAPSPWITLGTTNGSGVAELSLSELADNDGIWVREVLQENYVPFSYPPAGPTENSYSAELYCHKDGDHYDNFDQIDNPLFGNTYYCVAFNALNTGDLEVTKYNDLNGNGEQDQDEPILSDWEINVEGESSILTDVSGKALFTDLVVGEYELSETMQSGWTQTNITCDQEEEEEEQEVRLLVELDQVSDEINEPGYSVTVNPGQTTYCQIANQADPRLTIEKSNDATGAQSPGSDVMYTIQVELQGSDVNNVTVTDTTPTGFTYRSGSWTANSNVRGDISSLGEPSYGPGVWTLGNMVVGEIVTLTYLADVSNTQDSGTYKDIAWAIGNNSYSGDPVAAQGQNSQYVDGVFVGTDVEIIKNEQQTGSVNIEKTGEVLGASTELPATGAENGWIFLALGFLISGLLFIYGAKFMQKVLVAITVMVTTLSLTGSVQAFTPNNLSVRMESPKSPTRTTDWTLAFSTLDRTGAEITVKCYVKKPAGSFTQFDTDKVLSGGGNASCQVNGAILSEQGTYEFKVIASTVGETDESETASVVFDSSAPGQPTSYSKEHPWACRYIIRFHTADDGGATSWVEIYSSDQPNFPTDAGTRVGSVGIGSNQDGQFIHDRADNCDRQWYYVIRAFDATGNQSAHIGDSVDHTVTVNPTASPTGALIVNANQGSILGQDDDASQTGEIMGGSSPASSTDGEGLIAGATEAAKQMAKSKAFWWVLSAIIALGIIYAIARKKIQG